MDMHNLTTAMLLSTRERINPGEIRRQTGYMETCESCGSRYRRMCVDFRIPPECGCCYPVFAAKPDSGYTDGP
jgi:rRNA maturation endonuclease Nob1